MSTRHAMSHADAAWLHMDRPANLMVINSVLWFDEPVDWRRCRAVFCERIVERFDRFRQRAVDDPDALAAAFRAEVLALARASRDAEDVRAP